MIKKDRWYIAQTFSGHENAVKADLEKRIESMGMKDFIFDVLIPTQKIQEKKTDGTVKEIEKLLYPGYVFIYMIVTDESWYVVRNTPNVTGFLGSSGKGTKPIPVPEKEMEVILRKQKITEKSTFDNLIGKTVTIIEGPFKNNTGEVLSVDNDKEMVRVAIDMFGRPTPTDIEIKYIKEEE